jgi:hypothetical protein
MKMLTVSPRKEGGVRGLLLKVRVRAEREKKGRREVYKNCSDDRIKKVCF